MLNNRNTAYKKIRLRFKPLISFDVSNIYMINIVVQLIRITITTDYGQLNLYQTQKEFQKQTLSNHTLTTDWGLLGDMDRS